MKSAEDVLVPMIAAAVIGCILWAVVLWNVSVWRECRAAGHSVMYCMRMVSR